METNWVIDFVQVCKIKVVGRARKARPPVDDLVKSISNPKVGLLNPLILTRDYTLLAGERRPRAVRQLGWPKVPCRLVDRDEVGRLQVESDENAARFNFTADEIQELDRRIFKLSEKGALFQEELAKGRAARGSGERRHGVADALGCSHAPLQRAAAVNEKGVPELVDAMDTGFIAPRTAADIAGLPPDAQRRAVAEVRGGTAKPREAWLRNKGKPPRLLKDRVGNPLPDRLRDVFSDERLFEAAKKLESIIEMLSDHGEVASGLNDLMMWSPHLRLSVYGEGAGGHPPPAHRPAGP